MKEEITISNSADILRDVKAIIDEGRRKAYNEVNSIMIVTYWNIGRRIVEEEQHGEERAEYGKAVIKMLAQELTKEYGGGFSARYLAYFRQFYTTFPSIEILQTRLQNLRWSHILVALRVDDETARRWYLENAAEQMWSVRDLNRNISTQYFERHLQQPLLPSQKNVPEKGEILKSRYLLPSINYICLPRSSCAKK